MLRQRLVAAALGLPMLFVLLWLNWFLREHGSPDDLPLLGIVLLIAGASGWEVSRVVRQRYPHTSPFNGVYAALILPFMVHAIRLTSHGQEWIPSSSVGLLLDSLGITAAVMLLFLAIYGDIEQRGREGLRENVSVLLGGLYIGATLSSLLLLVETPHHEMTVVFVFMLVFALDTAAYFGGKQFGGMLLAPAVSPKKTVSGALCGLLATVVLALLFKCVPASLGTAGEGQAAWLNLSADLKWTHLLWLGLSIGIIGQVGDLVESAFKRWGGVKDSGVIIPGHGGFLDRFDSLFLAAPMCYLLLTRFLELPR